MVYTEKTRNSMTKYFNKLKEEDPEGFNEKKRYYADVYYERHKDIINERAKQKLIEYRLTNPALKRGRKPLPKPDIIEPIEPVKKGRPRKFEQKKPIKKENKIDIKL